MRDRVVGRLLERHRQDHVAAALEGLHLLEQRGLAVQRAAARRAADLVTGKRVEIAVERLHVDGDVRHRLRPVDEHRHTVRVRDVDEPLDRRDGPEGVRHVRERRELRALGEELLVVVDEQFAAIVDGHDLQLRALLLAEHLPRHDVRVVLEVRDDDLVAGADELAAVAVHHEIDALGAARREDDLALFLRVQEALHAAACAFIGVGRDCGQRVDAAMDVRVLVRLVAHEAVDDLLRHLARRGVVEEGQRLAVRMHVAQDREVGADALDVQGARVDGRLADGGDAHAISWPPVRSTSAASSCRTMDGMPMRPTISAAKPYVSRLRDTDSERPRLIR